MKVRLPRTVTLMIGPKNVLCATATHKGRTTYRKSSTTQRRLAMDVLLDNGRHFQLEEIPWVLEVNEVPLGPC